MQSAILLICSRDLKKKVIFDSLSYRLFIIQYAILIYIITFCSLSKILVDIVD